MATATFTEKSATATSVQFETPQITLDFIYENATFEAMPKTEEAKQKYMGGCARDLLFCFRVWLDSETSFRITRVLGDALDINYFKLYESAKKNTRAKAEIKTMNETLGFPDAGGPVMHIVSTDNHYLGAGTILCEDIFKELCAKMDVDTCFVLPSSIHELLVVYPIYGTPKSELDEMVRTVNQTALEPEDVLGDHCYIFNASDGSFTW